jgi:hypothetical protein
MIGLSFMTFRALDVLLYRSKRRSEFPALFLLSVYALYYPGRPNVPLADVDEVTSASPYLPLTANSF